MTPHEFIRKWQASELGERQASQEHFLDLCHLLGQPTPATADSTGDPVGSSGRSAFFLHFVRRQRGEPCVFNGATHGEVIEALPLP